MQRRKKKKNYSRRELLAMPVFRLIDLLYRPKRGKATPHQKGMKSRVANFLHAKGLDETLVRDFLKKSIMSIKARDGRIRRKRGFGARAWGLFREKCAEVSIDIQEW